MSNMEVTQAAPDMEVVLVANEKGGTGKTATVLSLAACLTALGYKVLMVDMDPSGNLSAAALPDFPEKVLYDVFDGSCTAQEAICHTPFGDVLPTLKELDIDLDAEFGADEGFLDTPVHNSKSLASIQDRLVGRRGAEYALAKYLRGKSSNLASIYDFILVDSAPADNILVTNAIVVADSVIVPCEPTGSSIDGLMMFLSTVTQAKRNYNTNVHIDGLLFAKYSSEWSSNRKNTQRIVQMAEHFGVPCYKTRIRNSSSFVTSMDECRPILEYMYLGNGAEDSMNFTLEFLRKRGMQPMVQYPGVMRDEKGEWIFRKNGTEYYTFTVQDGQAIPEKKRFRQNLLEDSAWIAEIGKTVFFDRDNMLDYLKAQSRPLPPALA